MHFSFPAVQVTDDLSRRLASEKAAVDAAVQYAVGALTRQPMWAAASAKSRASEAAGIVCASAHQLHGAIGFTREYALHRYSRRLWAWREEYGNEVTWHQEIGLAALSDRRNLWAQIVEPQGRL